MPPRFIIILMLILILLQVPILLIHEWNHHDPHALHSATELSDATGVQLSGHENTASDIPSPHQE